MSQIKRRKIRFSSLKPVIYIKELLKTHNSRLATEAKAEFTNVNEHFVEGA